MFMPFNAKKHDIFATHNCTSSHVQQMKLKHGESRADDVSATQIRVAEVKKKGGKQQAPDAAGS